MRVGLDIDRQGVATPSGIHMYLDGLLEGLADDPEPAHEYLAVGPTRTPRSLRDIDAAWAREGRIAVRTGVPPGRAPRRIAGARPNPPAARLLDRCLVRAVRLAPAGLVRAGTADLDVLHVSNAESPGYAISRARAVVATVHDLSPLTVPWAFSARDRRVWRAYLDFAARRADRIVAVSHAGKAELVDVLGVEADRVDVTPLAARPGTRRASPQAARAARERVAPDGGRFVLYAGTLEPRKNVERLLEAFAVAAGGAGRDDVRLVLAGGVRPGMVQRLEALAAELGIAGRLTILGYVSSADMNALMTACDVFAYVSLYEGFGLPVLEAMQCGAPVVTSNTTSLPEVVGDAALTVDPDDASAIAAGIERLLTDAPTAAALGGRAVARAATFTWARTAKATVRAYERAGRSTI